MFHNYSAPVETFSVVFGDDEGAVSRGWEGYVEGQIIQIEEDLLGLRRRAFSWMVIGTDGYLGASGMASSFEEAEQAARRSL